MNSSRKAWEKVAIPEIKRILACNLAGGLSHGEVMRRLDLYGRNVLPTSARAGLLSVIQKQFASPLVLVLCIAGVVTFMLGEYIDSLVITLALAINVFLGTLQEERAGRAFETLNASQERRAIVVRDGSRQNIPSADLVPGDVVLLEGGYFVPADLRILEEKDLTVNEAALTGEWLAVAKDAAVLTDDVPLAEQKNMAWMGTLIETGYGKGVVVATGERTQLGEIAHSLGTIDEQVTPLQRNIRKLALYVSYAIAAALVVLLIVGILRGEPLREMLFIAIAVAVAAIPAGLPAAVTIVLAIGMETILKHGGLVRNLLAAETLGATTIILTDKTGTLTQAHMKLAALHSYQGIRDRRDDPTDDNRFLLELAVTGSNAFIEEEEDAPNKLTVHGAPVEKAIVLAGLEAGIVQSLLLKEYTRLDYLQFTSARRFGASLHVNPSKKTRRIIISGEPEALLKASAWIRLEGKRQKATEHERHRFLETLAQRTAEGKRLVGIAYRDASFDSLPEEGEDAANILKQVVFAGFLAFEDPIRPDVHAAITEVQGAGAKVIMLTGDSPDTAHYIASKVGITLPGDEMVIRGEEIDHWSDQELYTKLQGASVIARALPAHKLRIARVLKQNGEVVAMTGDGINDAPALRAASIGVAIGSGTEVAKEASDLVLIDNSFSVIVAAIGEGRRIIDNLKKITAFLLSTSFSEIVLLGGALVGGAPLPLVPAQILWANIVGGDLMSFAFAFEPRDSTAMKRDPRSARAKHILTPALRTMVVVLAAVTGLMTVALYYWLLARETPLDEIRTIMFIALSLDSIFFSFSLKSFDTPIWRMRLLDNIHLLAAFFASIALLGLALFAQPMRTLLSLVPLSADDAYILLALGLLNLATIEFLKFWFFGEDVRTGVQHSK